jgi:hypothetical protein
VTGIDDLLAAARAVVARHALGPPGAYRRWEEEEEAGDGLNPYGCADAANILYTLGELPVDATERAGWIETLAGLQDPASGLFHEATHDPLHTTAHCIAALELFDARPRHPLAALAPLREPAALAAFLDGLDWRWNPWGESHRGAGLYAALVLAGEVTAEWEGRYFAWLWVHVDPATGLWRADCIADGGDAMLFHHLAGTFHYLFTQEYRRRPLRHPARLVDTCLRIAAEGLFPPLGAAVGFAEVDWVYCLSRALHQSSHRLRKGREALRAFAARYLAFLRTLDHRRDRAFNDLHQLFGAVCALAALQQALPGELPSAVPLRLVLDRRPFI